MIEKRISVQKIIELSFKIVLRNILWFLPVLPTFFIVPVAMGFSPEIKSTVNDFRNFSFKNLGFGQFFFNIFLEVLVMSIQVPYILNLTKELVLEKKVSLKRIFVKSTKEFIPTFLIISTTIFFIFLGSLFFLIPGIIAFFLLYFAKDVLILNEKSITESVLKSVELVKQNRKLVAYFFLTTLICSFVLSIPMSGISKIPNSLLGNFGTNIVWTSGELIGGIFSICFISAEAIFFLEMQKLAETNNSREEIL